MRFFITAFSAAAFCIMPFLAQASESGEQDLVDFGDTARYALPAAGLGISVIKQDWEGSKQWLRTSLSTVLLTTAAKESLNDTSWGERPNGGDKSFPSGHAAYACSGSAFLGKRYGWKYGVPAFSVAAVTAYSRVDSDKHHWRDVLGGCALAYGVNEIFVTKYGMEHVIPVVGPEFLGMRFHMPLGGK